MNKLSLQEFKEGIRSYEIVTLYDKDVIVKFLDWTVQSIHILKNFKYIRGIDNGDALKKCERNMYEDYLEKIKETK